MWLEWQGTTLRLAEWAELLGLSPATVSWRRRMGWPIEKILSKDRISNAGLRAPSVERRFWQRVQKTRKCWLWTGSRRNGESEYGGFYIGGRCVGAHVFSFELHYGRKPEGMVMHLCNVPRCVRPDHLKEGTCKDNLSYAASLGRMAHGSRNGSAKITENAARHIFVRYHRGEATQQALANEFGISQPAVSKIVRGVKWQRATRELRDSEP